MDDKLRVRQGKARLLRAVLQPCKINELLVLGEEIIGHPFALSTVSHLIWYVSDNMPQNPVLPQTCAATVTAQIFLATPLAVLLEDQSTAHVTFERDGYYYCFCLMMVESNPWGYSAIISEEPFSESDITLHKAFCDILVGKMAKQDMAKKILLLSEEENMLMHILEDTSYADAPDNIMEIFPNGTRYIEVVAGRYASGGGIAPDINVIDALKGLLECDICFGHQGGLVIALPYGSTERHRENLDKFAQDQGMVFGVSYPFRWMGSLRTYRQQAEKALTYCEKQQRKRVVFYHEIVLFDLLDRAADPGSLKTLCNFDIIKLYEYDKERGTDYCRTLSAYIQAGHSATSVAKAIGIHRNSVLSRINKIQELIDDKNVLYMDGLISLMILEYGEEVHKG